jgi:hypothetical protein
MATESKLQGRITEEELCNRFSYHDPKGTERQEKYDTIRTACLSLAMLLGELCPDSRERSVALTKLDEVMMWSNASIARS